METQLMGATNRKSYRTSETRHVNCT